MDLSLTESQSILKEGARKFLAKECPSSLVRQMEADSLGHSPQLWKKMAKMGWLDVQSNRAEMGFVELALLLEQMGATLLPLPFISTMVGALAIQNFGTAAQKKELLPLIAAGDLVITLAIYESDFNLNENSIQARAEKKEPGWRLYGAKTLVRDLEAADRVLCLVRAEAGVTAFLVDAADALVIKQPLETMAGDKQWDVFLNSLPVTRRDMIGEAGQGWRIAEAVLRWNACLWSAYQAGAADRVLSMTADYAKDRQQFGKPIGKFQAVQHKLADMMVKVEGARLLAYEAAWTLDQEQAAEFEVAAARAWCGDAFRDCAEEAMRLFASIGYAEECDIQLYYRRAVSLKQWLGDSHYQRAKIADLAGI